MKEEEELCDRSAPRSSVNSTKIEDFYNNRPAIRSSIQSKLRGRFVAEGGFIIIPSLQLLYVEIPAGDRGPGSSTN